ncbi:Acyl-CoA Delta(11) desaturase [Trachymyrmex cornetzi]|uniref:Acyl-CoA Delta(11) desaturase n=1 Tax=Trachymyrmex cornetzi TaxID=471704 RepID=A0A151J0F3_9HYME|nr:Acyl-CoA Delta(11) desaturase [Trachymyrmex cornetzi]
MSSFILSHDLHLMMLEIGVENLFVSWTMAFDKVILKKTIVMFCMLNNDWISLSPNRRDSTFIAADIILTIKRRNAPANAIANSAVIPVAENVVVIKEELDNNTVMDTTAISVLRKLLIMEFIWNVKADTVAITKTKGYAIKDNGERAFKKASSALSKSKCGRNTATIGITERGKRISPSSPLLFSSLQTYPLCCQLQPHLTCFTDCFDVSSCYCYWIACPFQFFYSVYLNDSTITKYEDNKNQMLVQSGTENGRDSNLNQPPKHMPAEQPLIWRNIIVIVVLHIVAIYLFATRYREAKFWTWMWSILYLLSAGFGITAGLHRLWAHRSYSAKLPLRILLVFLYCLAGQTHPSKWLRVHRTHHRYTDTCADPHNSNRGFFFSHIGWLMMKHHPAVKEYGKNVDMSDIAADSVICFVDKYYALIMVPLCFVLPAIVPVYVWNETWDISISSVIIRYVWALNSTFSVNSFAHLWGNRPYNRTLKSTENPVVSFFAMGEGWHNYHHCFPWDYKAAELGFYRLNLTTAFIDFMAWLGWAYDLKTPNVKFVDRLCANKGDGTTGLLRGRIDIPKI